MTRDPKRKYRATFRGGHVLTFLNDNLKLAREHAEHAGHVERLGAPLSVKTWDGAIRGWEHPDNDREAFARALFSDLGSNPQVRR